MKNLLPSFARAAFTLVELSIVLVILGLLVGGIMAGKSLIRQAELRSVITDYNNYSTAIFSFKDKYFYLPGDIPNAVSIWGGQSCAGGPGTCNGDGNGAVANASEGIHAWEQLSDAGLISANYLDGKNNNYIIGQTLPYGKLPSTGYRFGDEGSYYAHSGVGIRFGGTSSNGSGGNSNPGLSAEEAWNIDTKMDDGKAYAGKFVSIDLTNSNVKCVTCCFSGGGPFSNSYLLTDSSIACNTMLWIQ